MKVIVDLHAVQASQNGNESNDHSATRDGYQEWENHRNQKHGYSSSPVIKSHQSKQHQTEKNSHFTVHRLQNFTLHSMPIAKIKPKKIHRTEANHLIKQDHSIPKSFFCL